MKVAAVVLTGGIGSRMKYATGPKQFMLIADKPVFIHSLEIYDNIDEIEDIYLVVNRDYLQEYGSFLSRFSFNKFKKMIFGGIDRQQSVSNAMVDIDDCDIVVLHDEANPTTDKLLIKQCIDVARADGACTAVQLPRDTVIKIENSEVVSVFDRKELAYTCSPQVFKY